MTAPVDAAARTAALALLGLPRSATAGQIVDAYRRLVRATHPDATGRTDPAAGRRFAAIHDAYQLLTGAVEDQAEDPGELLVEPSRPHDLGEQPAAARRRSSRPATEVRALRPRPPIVAGPVMVTPLPEQHRAHPWRPR